MEPLDPKLARIVHEGMVQAVPGPEVEARVLRGLLARLPPAGSATSEGPHAEGQASGGEAGAAWKAAATTSGGKTLLLVAVLGVSAVVGGVWLGDRRGAQPQPSATKHEPARPVASARAKAVPTDAPSPMPEPMPELANTSTEPFPAAPAPASSPAPRAPASAPRAPSKTALGSDDLAAEIDQIAAADRALVSGDARRALQLAHAHATAYPHGQLALERTAIELGARCLLREPGAIEAAATFLREHAHAPAAAKVRTRCSAADPEQSIDP